MRGIVLAIALTLALGACGDDTATTSAPPVTDPPPSTTLPPTSTTAAPTTTAAPPTTAAPTTTAPATTTTTVAPTTTQAPAGLPDGAPPILAAGPNGVEIVGDRVLIPPIVDEPGVWVDAVPDGRGGLVYAAAGDAAQILWWWPADAAEPVNVSFKPGRVLHDAAVLDGRPTAVLVDNPDPSPDVEPRDYVQLLDLESGDTTTIDRQVGGIEWGTAQVSHGEGVFLVTEVSHSCGDLVAFDVGGEDVVLPGLPEPPCLVHFEVPFGGADFASDGSYAYVVHFTDDTGEPGGRVTGAELVVVSPDGAEQRIALSDGEDRFGPVSYEGGWAVVARPFRPDAEGPGHPLLVEIATETVTVVDGNGAHSFRLVAEPPRIG